MKSWTRLPESAGAASAVPTEVTDRRGPHRFRSAPCKAARIEVDTFFRWNPVTKIEA